MEELGIGKKLVRKEEIRKRKNKLKNKLLKAATWHKHISSMDA